MKKRKLVLIEWLDSHSGRGWQTEEQLNSACEPLRCRSVGWLFSDKKDCKVLVSHLAGEDQDSFQGCGDMTIPAKAILKTTVLKH